MSTNVTPQKCANPVGFDTPCRGSDPADADLSAKLATGHIEISIVVEAPADEATAVGLAAIRSAVHVAGGFTPGWDDAEDDAEWEMTGASSVQRAADLADA